MGMDGAGRATPSIISYYLSSCTDALRYACFAYLAKGFGRIWNFTALGKVPFPPSICHEAYVA